MITAHVTLCTRFMRIAFTLASKLSGREQECFWRIELRGKTLPVPRNNTNSLFAHRCTQHHERCVVAICGCLPDGTSGVYWSKRVLCWPQRWFDICRIGKHLHHSCTHCASSHAWVRVHACSTRQHFKNKIGVYPPTHKSKHFVRPKMLVNTDGP